MGVRMLDRCTVRLSELLLRTHCVRIGDKAATEGNANEMIMKN